MSEQQISSDFAQAVMKAAGVEPDCKMCLCNHERLSHDGLTGPCAACECQEWLEGEHIYPCPLTTGDGFLALWDALEAKGWRVEFRTLLDGTLAQVYKADEMGRPDLASIFQGGHEDRKAALVEAAGQALGVTR